jgi:cell wall-associated NlpC family hydrolase
MTQVTAGATTTEAAAAGVSGVSGSSAGAGQSQIATMLTAALSRVGMPYVWGAAGPASFDCSGLVQWSFAQAGVTMPRVAADQARTGPAVPVSQLELGDLLFYHTDPTDPGYISHVAIYLGDGKMIQAPETGEDVEVVPADTGSEFGRRHPGGPGAGEGGGRRHLLSCLLIGALPSHWPWSTANGTAPIAMGRVSVLVSDIGKETWYLAYLR